MSTAALSACKRSLLAAYYYSSQPFRACWNAYDQRAGKAPMSILFYHRVADDCPNDWTISTRDFTRHLDLLQQRFELISLAEVQQRLRSGENHRPAVSITFDDGYADNCRFALPLLVKRGIPCTYFVTLENVQKRTPFAHDTARGEPLAPNTAEQLASLAAAGIEIGAHTRTHPDLGAIADEETLYDEVIVSARQLAQLVNRPVRYFAFPFGLPQNLNQRVFAMAQEQGLAGVCSAYGGYNFPGDDPFHLQRIHGDPDLLRLKNWLTVDPRKRRTSLFIAND